MESNNHKDSLGRFFGGERVDGMKKKLAEILTSDDYKELRKEAAGWMDKVKIPGLAGVIVDRLDALLETPVGPALKKVYSKADILHRYLDPDEYDPEETVAVELVEHAITSTHTPRLEVVVNGQAFPALKLDVKLNLELKGLILTIRDARIWKISPGSCKGSGDISFSGAPLLKRESETYQLPPIEISEGIPIAP